MSQAALNTRNGDEEEVNSSRRNNGTRLAGILFLLTVLCTVFVSGWVVLGWMEDAQRLPLSKLVLTGERHYTKNDDIRQSILALGALLLLAGIGCLVAEKLSLGIAAVVLGALSLAADLGAGRVRLVARREFPELIESAAKELAPHMVAFYLKDLAAGFHSYYNAERMLVDDEGLKLARLALAAAVRQVIRNGLALLGVSAPDSM